MTAAGAPMWLIRAHGVALAIHGLLILLLTGSALAAIMRAPGHANAWREGLVSGTWMFLAWGILPSAIPAIAILSWWLLRRHGMRPSPGHRMLAIAGLIPFAIALILGAIG